jgi:hypothetical protein
MRHLGHGAAELLKQVVGLIGGQDCVRHQKHEAAGETQAKSGLVRGFTVDVLANFRLDHIGLWP